MTADPVPTASTGPASTPVAILEAIALARRGHHANGDTGKLGSAVHLRYGDRSIAACAFADGVALRHALFEPDGRPRAFLASGTAVDFSPIPAPDFIAVAKSARDHGVLVLGAAFASGLGDVGDEIVYADQAAADDPGAGPLLRSLSQRVYVTGREGSAKSLAAIHELVIAVNAAVVREAFALGACAGLDPSTLLRLLNKGSGSTEIMRRIAPELEEGRAFPEPMLDSLAADLVRAVSAAERISRPLHFASGVLASLQADLSALVSRADFPGRTVNA